MSYIIIKKIKSLNGQILPVILINSQEEIMEIDDREKAEEMADILNINSDSGHEYKVKKIGD